MYVHVGEDTLIRSTDIIAILDKETIKSSQLVKEYLEAKSDHVVHLTKAAYKSIVITDHAVYYSPLASGTLKKRSSNLAV